jgi:hypothetical protein
MDGVWDEAWSWLKTPGAFQHRFLIRIFPRSYGSGMSFLAERAAARQDFLAFLDFSSRSQSFRNISAPDCLGKTRPLFAITISSFACQERHVY